MLCPLRLKSVENAVHLPFTCAASGRWTSETIFGFYVNCTKSKINVYFF